MKHTMPVKLYGGPDHGRIVKWETGAVERRVAGGDYCLKDGFAAEFRPFVVSDDPIANLPSSSFFIYSCGVPRLPLWRRVMRFYLDRA